MWIGHGRRERFLARAVVLGAGVLIATTLAPRSGAAADLEKVLYSFCAQLKKGNCADGAFPGAGLIMDAAGNLYGTTQYGGAHGGTFSGGTAFELTPNAAKTAWTHKVLYNFCARGGLICVDGNDPRAGLIADLAGHLYGTTNFGGGANSNGGTVFELTPNAAKTAWTHKVRYSFCKGRGNCTDGAGPWGLIMDAAGHLYGTTIQGGAHGNNGINESGTAFELTP